MYSTGSRLPNVIRAARGGVEHSPLPFFPSRPQRGKRNQRNQRNQIKRNVQMSMHKGRVTSLAAGPGNKLGKNVSFRSPAIRDLRPRRYLELTARRAPEMYTINMNILLSTSSYQDKKSRVLVIRQIFTSGTAGNCHATSLPLGYLQKQKARYVVE